MVEYVSIELARALNRLGYPQEENSATHLYGNNLKLVKHICTCPISIFGIAAPTQAVAARWLRETYDIHVEGWPCKKGWTYSVYILNERDSFVVGECCTTSYELAMEAGLLDVCNHLLNENEETKRTINVCQRKSWDAGQSTTA